MAELRFYGASDDCVEVEGAVDDEFNLVWGSDDPLTLVVEAPNGSRLWLRAGFDNDTELRGIGEGWVLSVVHAEVGQLEGWGVVFGSRPDRDDDPLLIMTVPDGVTVKPWVETEDDD